MSTARPVLIVEDDDASREALVDRLAASGAWQPVEAATLGEATQLLGSAPARFDAVVLDADLPDGNGCDFCAQMRRHGHKMPVILVSRASEDADVVRGLEAGANDYISKPVRTHELLARLRAQLRLFDNSVDAVFTVGPYTFHSSTKSLADPKKNQRIRLTNKEVELLKFFHRAENRIVLRQTLLDAVWGYSSSVTTRTLATHIYKLRRKIEADPAACQLLITQPGGYQLNAAGRLAQ